MYTVKQVAEIAGVSIRTLHHYDEIGLLRPSKMGDNGYRYYDDQKLLRLQQILLYRELGMELRQIKALLDDPDFDYVAALHEHRAALQAHAERLQHLIGTVDTTIRHLQGEAIMDKKTLFQNLTPEQEEDNARLARLQYDPKIVNDSMRRWKNYSAAQRQAILDEGNAIYDDIVKAIEAGTPAADPSTQALFVRWHNHLGYFYEPTIEILRGLGELYRSSPEFSANFQRLHPDLPEYLHEAIDQYVDALETEALERMIAEDEAKGRAGN